MTSHRKTHYQSHSIRPILLAYFSYPDGDHRNVQLESSYLRLSAERVSRDETGFAREGRASRHGRHADQVARVPTGISLRSASEPAVRSTVLRCVGGASCPSSNRARSRRCGLGEHCEQLFVESSRGKIFPSSGASALNYGRTRRSTSSWRSASAARNARLNSTSAVAASLLMKRSWWCLTSYGPANGLESQAKEPKANAGSAVTTSGRPVWVRVGSSVVGSRTATSERMDATGGESAAPFQLCSPDWSVDPQINRAWRVALRTEGPAAYERRYGERSSMEAGIDAPRAHGGSIRRCRTSERFRGTAARGQVCLLDRSSSANFMQGRAARSARVAHNHKVVGSNPTPATSSGDGLGIHQPGSMTRGFASPRQPASGRARDRAKCPAVARFTQGRAA